MKNLFNEWLMKVSHHDPVLAGDILFEMLVQNPSLDNMIWALLKQTGDQFYSQETFQKVAITIFSKVDNAYLQRVA